MTSNQTTGNLRYFYHQFLHIELDKSSFCANELITGRVKETPLDSKLIFDIQVILVCSANVHIRKAHSLKSTNKSPIPAYVSSKVIFKKSTHVHVFNLERNENGELISPFEFTVPPNLYSSSEFKMITSEFEAFEGEIEYRIEAKLLTTDEKPETIVSKSQVIHVYFPAESVNLPLLTYKEIFFCPKMLSIFGIDRYKIGVALNKFRWFVGNSFQFAVYISKTDLLSRLEGIECEMIKTVSVFDGLSIVTTHQGLWKMNVDFSKVINSNDGVISETQPTNWLEIPKEVGALVSPTARNPQFDVSYHLRANFIKKAKITESVFDRWNVVSLEVQVLNEWGF